MMKKLAINTTAKRCGSVSTETIQKMLFSQQHRFESKAHVFKIDKEKAYKFHLPQKHMQGITFTGPKEQVEFTKEKLMEMYRLMALIRRFELVSDQQYKARNIRGFCHLYSGQEAVCVGIEEATTRQDSIITAYRDHGFQLVRGGSVESTMAEQLGRVTGCSKGKGGSMHMYNVPNKFYGGNGIVGAQVPVGAGLAFAHQYLDRLNKKDVKDRNVCFTLYGDGAANQGQVFEAFNMAKLWHIPVVFVCENNKYGMATPVGRSSASTDYYERGDYIPGIWVDGQDIFAVYEASRYAKEYAQQYGPIVLETETYRYYGHSMSDPGITYRTREEVQQVRASRDPIVRMKNRLIEQGIATEDEFKAIDEQVKDEVQQGTEKALQAPLPPAHELVEDVLVDKEYFVRGRWIGETWNVVQQ
ncbi:hypothetical protein C9374_011931 [Naegleria lovaniensis]|uniref:Pyruvate dehydrogenase E1 component subunit alpha n=1 Tax=Naegleria lovaniensis TaxID=51637 RepID=A0AA88KI86_NAELO|nr:uncharacterized protein C9374_011931 [Naegleria lovaniensis]KAG2373642.1 hypothetical protein C9374_011931 [Naegleria lovaniensis]